MSEAVLILVVYAGALLVLSAFSANRYVLVALFRRRRAAPRAAPPPLARLPRVTLQLPIYNELYVVERLIRSAVRVAYPRDRLQIQVLDDSTDETTAVARRLVRGYRALGVDIVHLRRAQRTGYKAGALAHGLAHASGEFVAVFDADFEVPRDFLRQTLPWFDDPRVGIVQTRWTYLNERSSLLTRINALGLSGQFVIEQPARDWGGLFLTFNGTAGIIRASCLRDAGGWEHDTITEDLDLSYRAQLRGWRIRYLDHVTCPSELPPDIHALKAQQFRWTKGSQQTARKHVRRLWRAPITGWQKVQGSIHLLGNAVYPLMVVVGLLNPAVMFIAHHDRLRLSWPVSAYFLLSLGGTCMYYAEAVRTIHPDSWRRRAARMPLFLAASIGLSLYNAQAAIEGWIGRASPFVRTPKHCARDGDGSPRPIHYRSAFTWSTCAELVMALYTITAFGYAAVVGEYGALPFLALFGTGYALVAAYSLGALRTRRLPAATPLRPLLAPDATAAGMPRARTGGRRARLPVSVSLIAAMVVIADTCGREVPQAARAASGPATFAAVMALPPGSTGTDSVALVMKTPGYGELRDAGDAPTGTFWYLPEASLFRWRARAVRLQPGRAYRVQLIVDGEPFDVASARANQLGVLDAGGALTRFADQVCMGGTGARPVPVRGAHIVRVAITNDGAPASGTDASDAITTGGARRLPCAGNDDGDYTPQLSEQSAIRFTGR